MPSPNGWPSSEVPGARKMIPFTHAIYNNGMSSIDIHHAHRLPLAQAREAVEQAVTTLGHRYGLDYRWEGDVLHFVRPGVDGRIALAPGEVHVTARLGMLLSAMKGTIESELARLLAERL
jgi:putative polyhydroxyalkanoate system protein